MRSVGEKNHESNELNEYNMSRNDFRLFREFRVRYKPTARNEIRVIREIRVLFYKLPCSK